MTSFSRFAHYNDWMNRKLYAAAAALPDDELQRERGAFFGSIIATLRHIMVADVVWLKRIASGFPDAAALRLLDDVPMPTSPVQAFRATLPELADLRSTLDAAIIAYCAEVPQAQLAAPLAYASGARTDRKLLGDVLLHVFNHQTHHRGQVSTLFSQMGIDIGDTDLLHLLPDVA